MDVRDLRYFAACCESGGITAAAARLHVAQPTLSHAIARLERELGQALVERSPNRRAPFKPTAAGRAVLARTRTVDAELSGLEDDLAAIEGVVRGELRIASIQSINATLLPAPLARFARAHPEVRLTLRTLPSADVPAAVREGRVDLGLMAGPPEALPGLDATVVAREEFVLIVRSGHPLAQRGEVRLAELADEPLVLVPPDTITGGMIQRAFAQAGIAPRVVLALDSGEGLRETVRAGLGSTILPEGYLPPSERDLRPVRLARPAPR
ncbi:MAG: LysR family transcriptional regulator, partial [Planctomycetes bacterium]|nr:LysR family transcriptional regulator [Planctomycetota bacterium]